MAALLLTDISGVSTEFWRVLFKYTDHQFSPAIAIAAVTTPPMETSMDKFFGGASKSEIIFV